MIGGSKNSYVATLVERHSRYVMLVKVANKDTESVVTALIKSAQKLPRELYKSLTWDRGKELADHPRFTLATDVDVYFCDPQLPWQRGSNENTNRLLRQYLPRGTDLSVHSQVKLSAIARQLSERPRKTLQYQTPAEKFAECVASTGSDRRTFRPFAHTAIAVAASLRGSGMLAATLQPKSPERPFKAPLRHEIQTVIRHGRFQRFRRGT